MWTLRLSVSIFEIGTENRAGFQGKVPTMEEIERRGQGNQEANRGSIWDHPSQHYTKLNKQFSIKYSPPCNSLSVHWPS